MVSQTSSWKREEAGDKEAPEGEEMRAAGDRRDRTIGLAMVPTMVPTIVNGLDGGADWWVSDLNWVEF